MEESAPKAEQYSTQLILGVAANLVFAALVAVLATVNGVLNNPITMPLWVYMTLMGLILGAFSLVIWLSFRAQAAQLKSLQKNMARADALMTKQFGEQIDLVRNQQEEREQFAKRIDELKLELREAREIVYKDGLYFAATDKHFEHPFCRVCYDTDETLTSIVRFYESGDGQPWYECPACQRGHQLPKLT